MVIVQYVHAMNEKVENWGFMIMLKLGICQGKQAQLRWLVDILSQIIYIYIYIDGFKLQSSVTSQKLYLLQTIDYY